MEDPRSPEQPLWSTPGNFLFANRRMSAPLSREGSKMEIRTNLRSAAQKRQFWVVSPNVNGSDSGTLDRWLEVIPDVKATFMGFGPKARNGHGRGGEWFADRIKEQDIVLIAHGRKRFVVGWGIVVSRAKKGRGVVKARDDSPLYYQMRRDLAPFKSNRSESFPIKLARHIPGYNSMAAGAIYKFKEGNLGQKKVCDWLEKHLGRATPGKPVPPEKELREEPPPPKTKRGNGNQPNGNGNPPPPPDPVLGDAGERLVLKYEQQRLLAAGRGDLEKQVRHVAREAGGNTKGYDILSFNPANGKEMRIEVKTTRGGAASPFYLTRREVKCSEEHPSSYYPYRVYSFDRSPSFYKDKGRLSDNFDLDPMAYVARVAAI
jgi:hypothetical protein